MVSVLTVVGGLTAVYIVALVWVARSDSDRFQQVGPLLMVRTQAGKRLIDRISKRHWWGWVSDIFILLTVLAGVAMVLLVVWQNTLLFTHSEQVAQNPPQVEDTLAIPGINPAIPIGYGLFALIVALVIHEGGHGVMARYAHMRVKSLGLLFLVIPVGAFVEPDEAALQGATLREKLRMFAGGPGPNMVLGAVCVLLFAQVFVPAMAPARDTGVGLLRVEEGLPADEAGLAPGDFITSIEGFPTDNTTQFSRVLDHHATTPLPQGAKFTGAGAGTASLSYNVTVPSDADPGEYEINGEYRFLPGMQQFSELGNTTIDVACPADGNASASGATTMPDPSSDGSGNVSRRAPDQVNCGETFTVDLAVDPPQGTSFWAVVETVPEDWDTENLVGGLRGDTLSVTYVREGETKQTTVEPRDKYTEYTKRIDGPVDDSNRGVPFFGVSPSDAERLDSITEQLEDPLGSLGLQGALFYLALPFINLQPFPAAFHDVFAVTGALAGLGSGFWIVANGLYWLFWINIVLGTFNALPMGPLDGGHMFRHSLHSWLRKRKGIRDSDLRVFQAEGGSPTYVARTPEVQDELDGVDRSVTLWNRVMGFGLLFLVVAPLIIPQFL